MSKRRNRSLNRLISVCIAAALLTTACSTARSLNCPVLDFQSILDSWNELRPATVMRFANRGFRHATEQQTNLERHSFVNVQFGAPSIFGCECCDTFSFEEPGTPQLVSVVSVRRAATTAEASAIAAAFWETISGDVVEMNAEVFTSSYTAQQSFERAGVGGFVGELSVARERGGDRYVVRTYVGR